MHRVNTKTALNTGAANTQATASIPASPADRRWRALKMTVSFGATPAAPVLTRLRATLPDTTTVDLWRFYSQGAIEDFIGAQGLQCPAGASLDLIVAAAGASITAELNLMVALEQ